MSGFGSPYDYFLFAGRVVSQRYHRSKEDERFFTAVLEGAATRRLTLPEGFLLWRAQTAHHVDEVSYEAMADGGNDFTMPEERPCLPARLTPWKDRAKEGRANPKGKPCLYLASNKPTAIAEVRPWKGAFVTAALMRLTRSVTVFNCATSDSEHVLAIMRSGEPTPEERDASVWTDIDIAFSSPVNSSDDVADYVPTQILAELFARNDYDGIAFRSSMGKGLNFAFFDVDVASVAGRSLVRVTDLAVEFSPEKPMLMEDGSSVPAEHVDPAEDEWFGSNELSETVPPPPAPSSPHSDAKPSEDATNRADES